MGHTHRLIQGLLEDRHSTVFGVCEPRHQLSEGATALDPDNVGAGLHDILDP